MRSLTSDRTVHFTESVIREMTRLIQFYHGDRGVNLAQGFPDFPAPQVIKDAACQAIQKDVNQYAITWGSKNLRNAIARKTKRFTGVDVDPETEITVTCGATEAMIASLMAVVNPGDEVIVLSPFYENYWPDAVLSGATPRYVTLHEPDWHIDLDELSAAFNRATKAIIINTPNNPTGKVFSRQELQAIADLCIEHNVVAITDEIYEHLVYSGQHVYLFTLPGMRERTITISGISKTYSLTGWRIGYVIACQEITMAVRKVHDFLTVGAAAPLQEAAALALGLPDDYYQELLSAYRQRRDLLLEILTGVGFKCYKPDGAYYIMTDVSGFGFESDVEMAHFLVREIGVAAVPGSSFYHKPELGRNKLRFAFCKKLETLYRAGELLSKLQ
jgi:aspartate/methionine/tyrosine aminotransferase